MPDKRLEVKSLKLKAGGFTLVELLITISIIAILSAIGLVVFSSVSKQGRDAKRQTDLRSIQSALEQYYADQLFYPRAINPTGDLYKLTNNDLSLTNRTGNPNLPTLKTYLNNIPVDPILNRGAGNIDYFYWYLPFPNGCNNTTKMCTYYCLYANLENNPSRVFPGPGRCENWSNEDPSSWGTWTPAVNFVVTLP